VIFVVIVMHVSNPWLYLLCANYDIRLIFVYRVRNYEYNYTW